MEVGEGVPPPPPRNFVAHFSQSIVHMFWSYPSVLQFHILQLKFDNQTFENFQIELYEWPAEIAPIFLSFLYPSSLCLPSVVSRLQSTLCLFGASNRFLFLANAFHSLTTGSMKCETLVQQWFRVDLVGNNFTLPNAACSRASRLM